METMDANEVISQQLLDPFKRLPEETILEILGKIQLRDLLVFRSGSKFWSIQLDNNPEFVRMTKDSFSLMFIVDEGVYSLDNNTLSSSLCDSTRARVEKIDCPLVPLGWDLEHTDIVGSCNGLFCMYRYNDGQHSCCLWNPCTNEIMRYALGKGHGFGYDSRTNDYKYVVIFCGNNGETKVHIHIYSFRTNTWKQVDVPYVFTYTAPNGVLYDGSLHWFVRKNSSYNSDVLLAFDMTEEGVREIPQPESSDVKNFGIRFVDVLDGCLCILYSNFSGFQVWVMKNYGIRESWTMMYNISRQTVLKSGHFADRAFMDLVKIECLKSGEILLDVRIEHHWTTPNLVLYDPKNETARVLDNRHLDYTKFRSTSYRYVKSLVKLNFGSHVGEDS